MTAVFLTLTLSAHAGPSHLPYPPHPGCYDYWGCVPQGSSWEEKKALMERQWREWGFMTPPAQFAFGYDGKVQTTSWAYHDGSTVTCKSSGISPTAPWTCNVNLSKYAQCKMAESNTEILIDGGTALAGTGGLVYLAGFSAVGGVVAAVGGVVAGFGAGLKLTCRNVEFGD